jgi:hypothetical protein
MESKTGFKPAGPAGRKLKAASVIFALLVIICSCGPKKITPEPSRVEPAGREIPKMGFAIQAGAFSSAVNASKLTESLRRKGIDAYYFVFKTGLYKVRFGNFPSEEAAKKKAGELVSAKIIQEFYIIKPDEYAVNQKERGQDYVRAEIVRSARSFIGVPYLWGGNTQGGLDCSGFSLAVYRLNGLSLPRSSREQFETGFPVDRKDLRQGDLVFFNTAKKGTVSHVGVYIGDGQFIHAPGRGKTICTSSLKGFYLRTYAGGRKYI